MRERAKDEGGKRRCFGGLNKAPVDVLPVSAKEPRETRGGLTPPSLSLSLFLSCWLVHSGPIDRVYLLLFFYSKRVKLQHCLTLKVRKTHYAPISNTGLHILPSLKKFRPQNLKYCTNTDQTNRDAPILKVFPHAFWY